MDNPVVLAGGNRPARVSLYAQLFKKLGLENMPDAARSGWRASVTVSEPPAWFTLAAATRASKFGGCVWRRIGEEVRYLATLLFLRGESRNLGFPDGILSLEKSVGIEGGVKNHLRALFLLDRSGEITNRVSSVVDYWITSGDDSLMTGLRFVRRGTEDQVRVHQGVFGLKTIGEITEIAAMPLKGETSVEIDPGSKVARNWPGLRHSGLRQEVTLHFPALPPTMSTYPIKGWPLAPVLDVAAKDLKIVHRSYPGQFSKGAMAYFRINHSPSGIAMATTAGILLTVVAVKTLFGSGDLPLV